MSDRMNLKLSRRSMIAGGAVAGAGLLAGLAKARDGASNGSAQSLIGSGKALGAGSPPPVAFLMDDGATMIDFAGPWEVFQDAGFPLFTVASTLGELQTTGSMDGARMNGLKFHADYTFDNAPQPKIILMGAQARGTPAKIDWIRHAAAGSDVVVSVCTGAFLLARTGLLDGLSATTHPNSYDRFAEEFPRVKLVREMRFVDNGKFITAGGLTAGIDTALHIVGRYYGAGNTQQVAEYMQYRGDGWKNA